MMREEELVVYFLVRYGQLYHGLFRAADELLGNYEVMWWERPFLRFVRWWAGRRLAAVLDAVPVGRRNEVLGVAPEEG